ncbi:hypothetical protein TNCV_1472731 [Trichonephila clavipes]|nr:hypothetical protein TNCV_1472731 [Trichonephila clavipes]
MSDVILMSTFVLLHSMWCLFEIFGHFNFQYCLHLIPYYIVIEILKQKSRNLKREVQNTDQVKNNSLAITEPKEKVEMSSEIAGDKTIQNYDDSEIDKTKEDQIMPDISPINIYEDTDAFSSGMNKTSSFKKFSPFNQRNNISEPMKQTSANFIEAPLTKYSKYIFYDGNEEKFIIDNAEFEEEEKELIDIFNSNSKILPSNPFYDRGSYNDKYHFIPISDTPDNYTDKGVQEYSIPNNHNNVDLEILPSNPFYERGSDNEDNHCNPFSLSASLNNFSDDDVKENKMPSYYNNAKLEILPNNPFYERGSYNEDNHCNPFSLSASLNNFSDDDVKEYKMPSYYNNAKLEILPNNPFYERSSDNEDNHCNPFSVSASLNNFSDDDVKENMPSNYNYAKLEILPNNPFYERGSDNEDNHCYPFSVSASLNNFSDHDVKENNMPSNYNYAKLEILPNNPFYERGSYRENDHFNPISVNTSPDNRTNEDVQESAAHFYRKKSVFKKWVGNGRIIQAAKTKKEKRVRELRENVSRTKTGKVKTKGGNALEIQFEVPRSCGSNKTVYDIRPQMLEKVIENWTSRFDYIRASRSSHMPEIIFKIDEAHLWLNGYVNKQNGRIWSEANPQVYVETPLHPEKLTVWCALWAGGILLQK